MYNIYDDGGIPFKVKIDDKVIKIFKNNNGNYSSFAEITNYQKVFIGNDKNNPQFAGNTILVNVKYNEYIFISGAIISFQSINKINSFVSGRQKGGSPYPYAKDVNNNIYLFQDLTIIKNNSSFQAETTQYKDPYDYYYNHILITQDEGIRPPKQPKIKNFMNVNKAFIDDESFTLKYEPFAEESYDDKIPNFGDKMFVTDSKGKKKQMVKSIYVELMKRYGEAMGFEPFHDVKIII